LLLLVFFTLSDTTRGQFQQSHEPQCKPEEPTTYDWERLNYYQLLGLTEDDDVKKKKKRKKKGHAPASNDSGPPITSKEIRKAYRKQAQKFHPDKQVSKKKASSENETQSSSSTTTTSKAISLEESNARFAKIAEAYEFLLDDTKRKDYDLFLEYCHNTEIVTDDEVHEGRLSTVLKKRFHGLFDDLGLSRDPFKVFKDVFFGGEDNDDNAYFDPNDPFSHLRYENNPQRHPQHQEHHPNNEQPYEPQEDPLRVFHDKRFMYDPSTGENVVRVLQTEEYPPSNSREAPRGNATSTSSSLFYYRIIAQDFQETYDPYNAKQAYVPITEPYLQEDGFRTASASRDQGTTASKSSSSTVESILHPWEMLTPRSKPMVSPNKRYIAGLTPDCELLVMINPDRFDGNETDSDTKGYRGGSSSYHHNDAPPEIIWSTQRPYGTNGYAADHCYALLKGPHLVVTVGANPQQPGSSHHNSRILWHSDGRNDEDDSRQGYYEYEDEFGFWHKRQRSYLAQLDNDGSLTVYSVWSVPKDEEDHKREQQQQHYSSRRSSSHHYNNQHQHQHQHQNHRLFHHHHHAVDEHLKQKPKVLVSNVAKAARDMWHGRIATKNEYDHLYSKTSSLTYKRCVYSTATHSRNLPPNIGCYRVSRKMTQLGVEATLAVRKLVFEINRWADAWLDLIYEEDDLFYFFKESIWKNSVGLSKMAGSSAKWVRKVLEGLKQLSHQYK
jgi:curved DNA-binding protein CbpA